MAKYKAYPEYKDSGLEWCTALPLGWKRTNLRWLSSIYAGGTPSKNVIDYWENGTIPWINSGAVNQSYVTEPSTFISKAAFENSSAKWIPKGALVVALAGQGKTKGMVAQLGINTTCNQSMAAIVFYEKNLSRYIYWWLTSNYQNIRNMAGGDLRDGLNLELLGDIQCPQPNDGECIRISAFLDHETAKIDNLIEKQQQLIELLKEKRQAVISHAVTKGLNPDVPMKDSGVEWLGEVPEHWGVTTLRNLIRNQDVFIQDGNHGELHPVAAEYVDEGIPFLMANNVRGSKVDLVECKRISKSRADKLRIGFAKAGDMLLTHKGTVGEVASIPDYIPEPYWMLTPQVTYYRWNKNKYDSKFCAYLFQSKCMQIQLEIIGSKQSTRSYVGLIAQGELIVVIPPLAEQQAIRKRLDIRTSRLEEMLAFAEKNIELMQERRTALISAAVTGKIDVRDWVAPDTQDLEEPQEATA